jgi:hypothetical protein
MMGIKRLEDDHKEHVLWLLEECLTVHMYHGRYSEASELIDEIVTIIREKLTNKAKSDD